MYLDEQLIVPSGFIGSGIGVGATICEKRNTLKARKARQGGRLSPEDETELARIRAKIKRTGHSCGGPFEDIVDVVVDVVTTPAKAIAAVTSSIPVLGDVTRIMSNAASAPLNLATSIASGARLDRAVVAHLKAELKNVKEAAPYAQMVVSIVPGVGAGVSAAIGAGVALAEGKSIDEIGKAAIRSAIPGGPLAVAAYDMALKVGAGANVLQSALEGARSQLSAEARKAFDIGLAVVTGEKIQTALANGLASLAPDQVRSLVADGQKALGPTLKGLKLTMPSAALTSAIKGISSSAGKEGFQLATGLLSQAGLNEKMVATVRRQLSADKLAGFDAALKTQEHEIAWLKNVMSTPVQARPPALKAVVRTTPPPARPPTLHAVVKPPPARPPALMAVVRKPSPSTPLPAPIRPVLLKAVVRKPGTTTSTPAKTAAATRASTALRYAPYPPSATGVSAPPGLSGPPPTCRTWGDPIQMSPAMERAARCALGASKGRPTPVRGPDDVLYLFAFEDGALTARPCTSASELGALGFSFSEKKWRYFRLVDNARGKVLYTIGPKLLSQDEAHQEQRAIWNSAIRHGKFAAPERYDWSGTTWGRA